MTYTPSTDDIIKKTGSLSAGAAERALEKRLQEGGTKDDFTYLPTVAEIIEKKTLKGRTLTLSDNEQLSHLTRAEAELHEASRQGLAGTKEFAPYVRNYAEKKALAEMPEPSAKALPIGVAVGLGLGILAGLFLPFIPLAVGIIVGFFGGVIGGNMPSVLARDAQKKEAQTIGLKAERGYLADGITGYEHPLPTPDGPDTEKALIASKIPAYVKETPQKAKEAAFAKQEDARRSTPKNEQKGR